MVLLHVLDTWTFNLMGKVIHLTTKPIPPKREEYEHAGLKYRCIYDQNAPPDKRWVWIVEQVITLKYVGDSPTIEAAARAARRKIHELNKKEWD